MRNSSQIPAVSHMAETFDPRQEKNGDLCIGRYSLLGTGVW